MWEMSPTMLARHGLLLAERTNFCGSSAFWRGVFHSQRSASHQSQFGYAQRGRASVFNPGCERLLGQLTGEHFERFVFLLNFLWQIFSRKRATRTRSYWYFVFFIANFRKCSRKYSFFERPFGAVISLLFVSILSSHHLKFAPPPTCWKSELNYRKNFAPPWRKSWLRPCSEA